MLIPRGKSFPLEKISSEDDQTYDAASINTASPIHYQLSCSGPTWLSKTTLLFLLCLMCIGKDNFMKHAMSSVMYLCSITQPERNQSPSAAPSSET